LSRDIRNHLTESLLPLPAGNEPRSRAGSGQSFFGPEPRA
jgi:hypothetical protein